MREITVPVPGRSYPIRIGGGLLTSLGEQCRQLGLNGSVALVYDAALQERFVPVAMRSLTEAGFQTAAISVPSGEGSKCLEQLGALYAAFSAARLDRHSTVIALGGGVVGDLAGFAAATYLRGISLVQCPTTLLAQVDASVGGKTAIDLPSGKNLAGAFYQPHLVLVDLDTLQTLPLREIRAGLAEVIKYGVISDPELLTFCESNCAALLNHQEDALAQIIARSCEIKADVVGEDEKESGRRAILNYGHTVAHAIETVAGYGTYLHGEAVALGMLAAGRLSVKLCGWSEAEEARVRQALEACGLPVRLDQPLAREALLAAMQLDKKTLNGQLRFVLAKQLGEVEVRNVAETDVAAVLPVIEAS